MKKTKKNQFAVIGGAGFLGKYIAKELIKQKYSVKIIDKVKIDNKNSYICDIMDYNKLKKLLSDCDYVFNFAGVADIGESNKNPLETIKANIIGSTNIFDICAKLKIKRVFFASTLYVYSSSGGFYKTTKQSLENILETYSKNFNLKYTVLRYGSIFGPSSQKWNGIYNYLNQALNSNKIICNGNGDEVREYIHVKDAAKLTIKCLKKEYENKYLTISGVNSLKARDLFLMISEILNKKIKIVYKNNTKNKEHYKITPYNYVPKRSLKVVPNEFIDLGEGLLEVIEKDFNKNS